MGKSWPRQAAVGLALLCAATGLPADGNVITVDHSQPERMVVPPARKDIGLGATIAAPGIPGDGQVAEAYARFEQLMENGAFDEADSAAKELMELVIRQSGIESAEAARALTNLAIVQHRMQQYEAATSNYESAIEIIETSEDRLNSELVNPLKGLAVAQLRSGRPDQAVDTYRRAVHVTHVNEGPHNPDQLPILHDLSDVELMMGERDLAIATQETIYSINVRTHELDSIDLVPALMRRAEWQHDAGLINAERETYRQALRIIEKQLGRKDIAMVEPLVRLGRTYFYEDMSGKPAIREAQLATGEIYLKRAVRIAAESPDTNWRIVANATLTLGDFHMHNSNPIRARQFYRSVWKLLSENENNAEMLEMRRNELEIPVVLREHALPGRIGDGPQSPAPNPDDPVLEGSVTVRYNLTERGRPDDIEVVEANPPEFDEMAEAVVQEFTRRIYRPQLADGEPVPVPEQAYTHTYSYRSSLLDQMRQAVADVNDNDG